jgi:hypothetical protein
MCLMVVKCWGVIGSDAALVVAESHIQCRPFSTI